MQPADADSIENQTGQNVCQQRPVAHCPVGHRRGPVGRSIDGQMRVGLGRAETLLSRVYRKVDILDWWARPVCVPLRLENRWVSGPA
jgi:hypothetical protein